MDSALAPSLSTAMSHSLSRSVATKSPVLNGTLPGRKRAHISFNAIGSLLLVLTIAAGLLVSTAGRDAGNGSPMEASLSGASSGSTIPEDEPDGHNAPGGGYQETAFTFILIGQLDFPSDLLDGRFATLESWKIAPGPSNKLDTSAYRSSGIAVAFVVQGAMVATFERQVTILRRLPLATDSGTLVVEAGQQVELVIGDAVAYEIGQIIDLQNPFPALPTELMQVTFSDDTLPAVDSAAFAGVSVTRQGEQEMPVLLSSIIGAKSVGLSTYWNISGSDVNTDRKRTLFAPERVDDPVGLQHGYVINIGAPIG